MGQPARNQLELLKAEDGGALPSAQHANGDLVAVFRRVYFHLYSNSRASRAETILEDICLLLLAKLASERHDGGQVFGGFCRGEVRPSELVALVRSSFPKNARRGDAFHLDDDHLRSAASELERVSLDGSAAHVLGDAFQALIGPKIRGEKGQFFTPRTLVRAMVEIVGVKPNDALLDPACGTGGFLYEAVSHVAESGKGTLRVVGLDKDKDLARLASALLTISSGREAEVQCINSLDDAAWSGAGLGGELFDVVLTNPPFGSKIAITDQKLLARYDLGHEWIRSVDGGGWVKSERLLLSQDPQILFIELCIRRLKPGGRLGIVLPEGVFGNTQGGYVWDFIRSSGVVTALLDCPRTTFQPGTDTKTNVLFFLKHGARVAKTNAPSETFSVGVAIDCGHDRRGRAVKSDGTPFPDDFSALALDFRRKAPKRWARVTPGNPYYLVPRYYVDESPQSESEATLVRGAKLLSIGELVAMGLLDIRKGNEVGSEAYGTGDVPFVRTSDISNFEISTDPTKSVSDDIYERYCESQRLRAGSILMVVDGRYRIGATAIVTSRTMRCVVQSHVKIIDVAPGTKVDPYAVLYSLSLPSVRRRIRDLVFVQSTLGTLGKRLLELKLPALWVEGPWSTRVEGFRSTLLERDRLLGELASQAQADVEL